MNSSRYLIANWKMYYHSQSQCEFTIKDYADICLKGQLNVNPSINQKIIICPSYPYLDRFNSTLNFLTHHNHHIYLGAQDLHHHCTGAYTGDVSAPQLRDLGCKYVIIGHYERKKHYNLDLNLTLLKLKAALENHLIPILCISSDNKNPKKHIDLNLDILIDNKDIKKHIHAFDLHQPLIIAYEPSSAIGGSKALDNQQIEILHLHIKNKLQSILQLDPTSSKFPAIIYGGSLNNKNYQQILNLKNVDGGLFGRASIDIQAWSAIVGSNK